MKKVSNNDLKQKQSLNQPGMGYFHQGARFGNASLKPAVRSKTAGRFLEILQDERQAGRE
jgi:hypothetical protein